VEKAERLQDLKKVQPCTRGEERSEEGFLLSVLTLRRGSDEEVEATRSRLRGRWVLRRSGKNCNRKALRTRCGYLGGGEKAGSRRKPD